MLLAWSQRNRYRRWNNLNNPQCATYENDIIVHTIQNHWLHYPPHFNRCVFHVFFFVHQKLHVILCEFNAFRRKRFLFHILCACAPYFYFVFLEQTVCRPLEKIARKTFVQIHRSKQVYVESQCCCCCCDFDLSDNVFIPCAFVNISIYSIWMYKCTYEIPVKYWHITKQHQRDLNGSRTLRCEHTCSPCDER